MTVQERLQQLQTCTEPLFAVLDAAQSPAVLALLKLHEGAFISLYAGASARSLEAEALQECPPARAKTVRASDVAVLLEPASHGGMWLNPVTDFCH